MTTLLATHPAIAGLYGFDKANPYTAEEKILDMKYLPKQIRNYRADMRNNLQMLINYAKKNNPDFKIITHEGQEILYRSAWEDTRDGYNLARRQKGQQGSIEDTTFLSKGKEIPQEPQIDTPEYDYLHSVDAVAINGLYCGDGKEQNVTFNNNLGLISIDYCPSSEEMDSAIIRSILDKKMLYAFENRELAFNNISSQAIINDSAKNINQVADAKNILIITDDSRYSAKDEFVKELNNTNYDIIIINPLFNSRQHFTPEDIQTLRFKKNGGRRLLIAAMNVSETTPRDYFWNSRWKIGNPSWLARPSLVDADGVITEYWDENWRKIISQHFKDIMRTGFDGVFFTGLQNHFHFEKQTPLE